MYPNSNIAYSLDSVTYDTEHYTASLDDAPGSDWDYCPLCGEKLRFGQQTTEGPNRYALHGDCYSQALHAAVEADEDVSDPCGEWLSDAISEAILARGEQYDTGKYPQLWNTKIR